METNYAVLNSQFWKKCLDIMQHSTNITKMKLSYKILILVASLIILLPLHSLVPTVSTISQNSAAVAQLQNSDAAFIASQAEFSFW